MELLEKLQAGNYEPNQAELELIFELNKRNLVYQKTNRNGKKVYGLEPFVTLGKNQESLPTLTAGTQAKYVGLFFEHDDVLKCISADKAPITHPHVTLEFLPELQSLEAMKNLFGKSFQAKVVARGYNLFNEGLKVELPKSLQPFYFNRAIPHITLGLSEGAKAKDTALLEFSYPEQKMISGKLGMMTNRGTLFAFDSLKSFEDIYTIQPDNTIKERHTFLHVGQGKMALEEKVKSFLISPFQSKEKE